MNKDLDVLVSPGSGNKFGSHSFWPYSDLREEEEEEFCERKMGIRKNSTKFGEDRKSLVSVLNDSGRQYVDKEASYFARIGVNVKISMMAKAWGVTSLEGSNLFYIADRENDRIVMLNSEGDLKTTFGWKGSEPGQLFRPTGLAMDARRNVLYVTDKDNHRVCLFSQTGKFLGEFGKKGHLNGEFNYPWGIALSPDGQLVVVADSRNHRLQLFDIQGNFLRKYSVYERNPFEYKDAFNYPRGVAFSPDGAKIYVTDFNIHSVFVLDSDLATRKVLIPRGRLLRPQGIAVDAGTGNIYVADSRNNCVRVVSSSGAFVCDIKLTGGEAFSMPMDIHVLPHGKILVTDSTDRLRIF